MATRTPSGVSSRSRSPASSCSSRQQPALAERHQQLEVDEALARTRRRCARAASVDALARAAPTRARPPGGGSVSSRRRSSSSASALLSTSMRCWSPAPISSSTSSTARSISPSSSSGALASTTCRTRSARTVSSSVAANASTSPCGQLADEADRVRDQVGAAVQAPRAGRRVQRVEQAVAHGHLGARQRVEQRGLAGVRVAGERHGRQMRTLALGAHHRARALDLLQPAAQRRDAVARQAAVGLDLRLTRTAGADAADAAPRAKALEVRPQPAHAGHVVLELRELDLQLALGRVRVAGEDVEDHRGAVEHRARRARSPGCAAGAA